MRHRFATVLAVVGLAACSGLTNTPDPNVLHVANLSYGDTACGPTMCDGKVQVQLLNSANVGRMGVVLIFVYGAPVDAFGVNVRPDGWGWVPVTLDRAKRPYRITACPEGVPTGSSQCATGSTG